jgi:radical SAM protein with 4Fe4S-binding SPASM domain
MKDEIGDTFSELLEISTGAERLSDPNVIERSLTSKTTVAMISVTRICNLKCPHCYVDACGWRGDELTLDEHRYIAKNLFSHLATTPEIDYKVNLTGGEPFTVREIMRIISAYKEAGFSVTMSTNGLLIKDEYIPKLRDMEVALSISLDGASSKTHDFIRGQGSFSHVVEKIAKLTASGVRVGINSLMHEGNFHEFEKIIDLAHRLGCNGFNPINLVQLGRAINSNLKRVSEVEIFKRIAEHLRKNPNQINMFAFSSLFASMGAALYGGVTCENCGLGNRPCIYITETGDVFPCPNTQKEEFKLGNTRIHDFTACVNLEHDILKKLRVINVDSMNATCSACDVRYFCGGDCRGETYNVTNDIGAPYVACQDRHDSIVELMWTVSQNPEFFSERAEEYLRNAKNV